MNPQDEATVRKWLDDNINKKILMQSLKDLNAVIKLTQQYITEMKPLKGRWIMVGVASMIAELQKQEKQVPPLERFVTQCREKCPLGELTKLLEDSFFQNVRGPPKKICGYEVRRKLGQGTYGTVSMVRADGTLKALKIITSEPDEGLFPLEEIDVCLRLKNPYLVHADKLVLSEEKTCEIKGYGLLLPLGLGDANFMPLNFVDKVVMLYDVLLGLKCLHKEGILHGDIKPGNIIVFPEEQEHKVPEKSSESLLKSLHPYEYRLTDFGISMYLDPHSGEIRKYDEVYTSDFRPPEGLGEPPYIFTKASDVWALGVSFFLILTGRNLPFVPTLGDSEKTFHRKFIKDTVASERLDQAFLRNVDDLLEKMLAPDPSKRPGVEELLEHPLFEQLWSQGIPKRNPSSSCVAYNRTNAAIRTEIELLTEDPSPLLNYEFLKLFQEFQKPPVSLFRTIDLFYQAYPRMLQEVYSVRIPKLYLVTCIWMVLKLGGDQLEFDHMEIVEEARITHEEMIQTERKIVEHLEGKLVRKSYFDYIQSESQVEALVKLTKYARDYLAVNDFQEWAQEQGQKGSYIGMVTLEEILKIFDQEYGGETISV